MSHPTPYLELLLLLAAVYPSGLSHSLGYVLRLDLESVRHRWSFLGLFAAPYVLVALATLYFLPALFESPRISPGLLLLGFVLIPVVASLEYATGIAYGVVRTGRLPTRAAAVHQFWSGPLSLSQHASLAVIAIGEEFVFRLLDFNVLVTSLGLSLLPVLAITSLLYALNHTQFGMQVMIQKLASGVLFGLVYFATGSLLVPLVAHVGYNWSLVAMFQRRNIERSA
jgi:membrane protease YdiL (CAAX protease family)